MGMMYKANNVFDEALERIRMIYDYHDDVIVSMSGGKDSTVLFNLALIVAKEKNRIPLKVFWLDQEAEWQHTVDYMDKVMRMPEVKPYWFQMPFDFTNSLSWNDNFLRVWDEAQEDKWIHSKSDISIKKNPSKYNRFHDLVTHLPEYCVEGDNCAVLVGMRISESLNRRMAIAHGKAYWHGETWCQKKKSKTQVFWCIYDFIEDDIWTAIAKNHWEYNKVYDIMYRWGVPKKSMRVSALIHETSWHSIEMLHEFEPETYNKFIERVHGVNAFERAFESNSVIPKQLPFAFANWKEYRDYLLVHLVKPEYWNLFKSRWAKQDGDEWYKTHVKEVILNDIDGTNNANMSARTRKKNKMGANGGINVYNERRREQFIKWKAGETDD